MSEHGRGMRQGEARDIVALRIGAEDRTVNLGVDHFRRTFGLPRESGTAQAWVAISYEGKSQQSSESTITIRRNAVSNEVQGYLLWRDVRVPLFERPTEIPEKEQVLAWFTDDQVTYPCVVAEGREIEIGFDVFQEVGKALTCKLMAPPIPCEDGEEDLYGVPFVDCYEWILFECLLHASLSLGVPMIHKAFWPNGEPFAVFASHDVDRIRKTFQYPYYFARALRKLDMKALGAQVASVLASLRGSNPYWNFEKITAIEKRLNVRSTFFFLHETGRPRLTSPASVVIYAGRYDLRSPALRRVVKELAAEGWEVGLHGSYESFQDGCLLGKEKEVLEGILMCPVQGVRQHYLRMSVPQTLEAQEKIDLAYDSTMGFSDRVGFRAGTSFPFFPDISGTPYGILEIPMALMDGPLFRYSLPWNVARGIAESVQRVSGVLTIDWHQRHFNAFEGRGYEELYKQLLEYCREVNAWFATGHQIDRWWRQRDTVAFRSLYADSKLSIEMSSTQETTVCFLLPRTRTTAVRELQTTGAGEASIESSGHGSCLKVRLLGSSRQVTVSLSF